MKKKLLIIAVLLSFVPLHSQIHFEGVNYLTNLRDITYDLHTAGKIYARSGRNHILVSGDQGANWSILYSHSLPITKMLMAPDGNSLTFAGEDGISKYDIATNTVFNLLPSPVEQLPNLTEQNIMNYYLHDNATALLHIQYNLLEQDMEKIFKKVFYISPETGNWQVIYDAEEHQGITINNMAIAPDNAQKIFLTRTTNTGGINNGMLLSLDGGETFTSLFENTILGPIAFKPGAPNEMIVGTAVVSDFAAQNLYKSIDGGLNWNQVTNLSWTDAAMNNITCIAYDPDDTQRITVLEENEIVTSADGGASWHHQAFEMNASAPYYSGESVSFDPFHVSRMIITNVFFPKVTADYGQSFTTIHGPFFATGNVSTGLTQESMAVYYNASSGYLRKDLSSGETEPFNVELPWFSSASNYHPLADPIVPGRVFIFEENFMIGARIHVSDDNGAAPLLITNSPGNHLQAIAVAPSDHNIVYLSVNSTDMITGEIGIIYKVNLANHQEITVQEIPNPQFGPITSITVDPNNADVITITLINSIFTTPDNGITWNNTEPVGLDISTFDLILDMERSPSSPGHFILGSTAGVYSSGDGGSTWSNVIEDAVVHKVSYSPIDANIAVAATRSSAYTKAQFWVTVNGGASWKHISPQDLFFAESSQIDFVYTQDKLTAYLATSDLGLISYTVDLGTLNTDNPVPIENNPVVLYPNPASDILNIKISDNQVLQSVSIYSVTGQKVVEGFGTSITIGNLSNGIYMVRCTMADGKSYSQKLIKQ